MGRMMHSITWLPEPGRRSIRRVPAWLVCMLGIGQDEYMLSVERSWYGIGSMLGLGRIHLHVMYIYYIRCPGLDHEGRGTSSNR
jgi:hypothetical protein